MVYAGGCVARRTSGNACRSWPSPSWANASARFGVGLDRNGADGDGCSTTRSTRSARRASGSGLRAEAPACAGKLDERRRQHVAHDYATFVRDGGGDLVSRFAHACASGAFLPDAWPALAAAHQRVDDAHRPARRGRAAARTADRRRSSPLDGDAGVRIRRDVEIRLRRRR